MLKYGKHILQIWPPKNQRGLSLLSTDRPNEKNRLKCHHLVERSYSQGYAVLPSQAQVTNYLPTYF